MLEEKKIDASHQYIIKADKGKGYQWVVEIMAGLKELDVDRWAKDFFHKYFAARAYAPQKQLIAELKAKGFDVWIVSASNRWIVQAGAPYMGIAPNRVIGVDMQVENGVLTNRLKGHMTYAAGKVDAINAHMAAPPVEGRDYTLVSPPQPTEGKDKIEVILITVRMCQKCQTD